MGLLSCAAVIEALEQAKKTYELEPNFVVERRTLRLQCQRNVRGSDSTKRKIAALKG